MEIKRREYGTGTDRRSVHFELWLDGRRVPTATAVVEEGGVTVNWSALGDVPPRLALDFAQGLAALTAAVNQEDAGRLKAAMEDSGRLKAAIGEFLAPIAGNS